MRIRKLARCDENHIVISKSRGGIDSHRSGRERTSQRSSGSEISETTSKWASSRYLRNAGFGIPGFVLGLIVTVLFVHTNQSSGLVIPQSNEPASTVPFPYPTVGSSHYTNSSSSPTLPHPRRLSRLPKSRRNVHSGSSSRPRYPIPEESAKSRARLLLGSLNRQNCFAKVLCGLGARAPTTKTDLVNDYVYLMEELMVDDEDDEDGDGTKKSTGKSSSKKKKKNKDGKPVFKNDNSDSSQSDEEDANSPLGFMAEGELAAEDPQVLKYVRLEQKRRKYKDSIPKTSTGSLSLSSLFSKRQGKDDTASNVTVTNDENAPLSLNSTTLRDRRQGYRLRKARQLVRQVKQAVKTGRTLGSSRQCRTIFDRCPFDEVQMNEIVTNLRKMMQGKTAPTPAASSPTQTVSTTVNGNQVLPGATTSTGQGTGGAGSKVEIVLHLNQNGLPYNPGLQYMQPYGVHQYPIGSGGTFPGASFPVAGSHAGPGSPVTAAPTDGSQPPMVSAAPLVIPTSPAASLPPSPTVAQTGNPPGSPVVPPAAPVAQPAASVVPPVATEATTRSTTPTTTTTEATTVRTIGEEQLLDFLYGAVNFNESDPIGIQPLADVAPNPFWSSLASSIPDPFADDFEQQLKVQNKQHRKKFPSWNADDDDDDDSKSSEEMELKKYLVSLRETLQGLAQMNNATLAVETKVVRQDTSEEDDSAGDPLDDDLPLPGIVEVPDNESDESDEDEPSSKDKEVNLKTKGKKKKNSNKNKESPKKEKKKPKPTNPSPDTTTLLIAGSPPKTTKNPTSTKNPPPAAKPSRPPQSGSAESSEILFDDDEEENDDQSSPNFGPEQIVGSNFGSNRPKQQPNKRPNKRPPSQDDDEFEPEESGENNSSGGNNNQDDEGEPSFEEPSNEESEEASKKPKKTGPTKPPRITFKFDPDVPMQEDLEEMTPKERRKLLALSNALLPAQPPVRPVSPEKLKPPVDFLEEIRIPTAKPVANEFQAVANIVKSTEVINIDEFAEDSGKDPTFPKKSTKRGNKKRRIHYQNRRRPALTRPLFQRDDDRLKPVNGPGSSEENFSGAGRAESLENPGGPLIARPVHGPPELNYGGQQQFDIFGSMMNMMGLKPVDNPHFRADPNDAMEKHPLYTRGSGEYPPRFPHPSNQPPQHFVRQERIRPSTKEPKDDRAKMSLDDLPTPGEDYKLTIKPADPKISINIPLDEDIYKQPQHMDGHSRHPSGTNFPSSYPPAPPPPHRRPGGPPGVQSDDDNDEYSDEQPYDYVEPSHSGGEDKPELDLPPTAGAAPSKAATDAKKKGDDGPLDDEKKSSEEHHEDDKKKKKGKKKKKDHKKKDDKKKDHKKKDKKKKHHKGWGHHGYSQQFHQQVFPEPEKKNHGIWAKIKDELGAIASGFGDADKDGWVSFIDLGFKDEKKDEGNPGHPPIGPHVNTYGPPPHGPHHQVHYGDDDNSRSDEEEDDLTGPEKDIVQDEGEEDDDDDDGSSEGEDEDEDEEGNSEDEDKEKEKKKEENGEGPNAGASQTASANGAGASGSPAPGGGAGAAGGSSAEGAVVSPVQAPAVQEQDTAGNDGSTTPKTVEDEEAESGEKTSSTTTTKAPIAPKPPKYKVKRNRNKVRGKKKKKPQPSKGPPITLFVTTTEKIPQTTLVPTEPPRPKPPKRRILYKPPAAKVHTPPGTALNIPTTAKPLPPPKSSKNKQKSGGGSYHEDDEVEPPSVFFQPGPNGQNIRGKPPIPIPQFHIQSEDMLEDPDLRRRSALNERTEGSDEEESAEEEEEEEEDENSSSGAGRRVIQYRPSGGDRTAPISIEALYKASEDSEEMRGGGKKKKQNNRRQPPPEENNDGPFNSPYGTHGDRKQPQPSQITSAVMNSAIFSDHFKHLYTKVQSFGQSFMTPNRRHPHSDQEFRGR